MKTKLKIQAIRNATDIDPAFQLTALNAISRQDFPAFIRRCFHLLSPAANFYNNWHILALAYHLELVRLGKIKRLIINVPPRSLKSVISSVAFPAWLLGHDPTKRIITVSYGSDLAAKHANDFRAVLTSPAYRQIFPQTRISAKNTESEVVTTRNGYRLTTSIDGTLTGRGGDIIIVDDPLKPIDVLSGSKRERVNQWYFNTLLSRLDDKRHGAIIIVMQRLHLEDLTGEVLRTGDEWVQLSLPAIAVQDEQIAIGDGKFHERRIGDVLHPQREPIAVLESYKRQLGSETFAAQYQQMPVPSGGGMIKRKWVRRYDVLPMRKWPARVILSLDTASKEGAENDWSVCTAWLIHEHKYYLIDVLRGRFDYPTLKARLITFAKVHGARKVLIEDTGVGTALLQEIKRIGGIAAVAIKPEHSKKARMSIELAKFESGQVYFPQRASWLPDLEEELFAFPQSRHDDQVDSISQALAHARSGYDSTLSWID